MDVKVKMIEKSVDENKTKLILQIKRQIMLKKGFDKQK